MSAANLNDLPQAKPHFIEPMYARAVQKLPDGKDWLYEIKLDGYRAFASNGSSGVRI